MKAYKCTDEDLYAANSAEEAAALCKADQLGEPCLDGYPEPLTDAELDARHQSFDEDENPIDGETTSIREMLAEHGNEPGWLAGSVW